MKVWRFILEFAEWLPIFLAPLIVYWLTEGFTTALSAELWLIIGLAVAINLGWIGFVRWNRGMVAFYEKYPGFRWKR